ncbi:MAG: helix-turn-helix domain-containing protein [Chloroflexota bacterium]|nr:TetR/AcrR family transcriptional regulator [Anaerolineales bacterium]MCA9975362.1 TetR/AcrR family transcriptional regulator [Anaerolineales bacterium]
MPRPRFNKLSADKRERILEAAAKEFAAHGFDGASLNKILEEAGISKGAAYYYFDDKADLYTTTLLYYLQELLADMAFDVNQFTAENFWAELTAVYRHQLTHYYERPWVFGIAKSGGPISPEALANSPMAALWESAQGLLVQLVQRGQELGVIRHDLPDDLLQALLLAIDDVHDRWLFSRWADMSPADIEVAAGRITDILRRLLEPR